MWNPIKSRRKKIREYEDLKERVRIQDELDSRPIYCSMCGKRIDGQIGIVDNLIKPLVRSGAFRQLRDPRFYCNSICASKYYHENEPIKIPAKKPEEPAWNKFIVHIWEELDDIWGALNYLYGGETPAEVPDPVTLKGLLRDAYGGIRSGLYTLSDVEHRLLQAINKMGSHWDVMEPPEEPEVMTHQCKWPEGDDDHDVCQICGIERWEDKCDEEAYNLAFQNGYRARVAEETNAQEPEKEDL